MQDFNIEEINKMNKKSDRIHDFYHNICKKAFNSHELETYDKWIDSLNGNENIDIHFLLTAKDNLIVGGIVFEVHKYDKYTLISYIAIDEKYRGYGLSKILVYRAISIINKEYPSNDHIFIEVLVPEVYNDCIRQQIWDKLNFMPFNVTFEHPGHLKWKKYQLAVFNKNNLDEIIIPKKTILNFFEKYFYLISNEKELIEYECIKKELLKDNSNYIIANKTLWASGT